MSSITRTTERRTFASGSIRTLTGYPLIIVIHINFITLSQRASCIFTNDQSCTWQQSDILSHGHATRMHINRHITINRQDILTGIDGIGYINHNMHRQRNTHALNLEITIGINQQSAGRLIIVLDNVTAGNLEHTIGTDERNSGTNQLTLHLHSHITILNCTLFQCQGHFDVLDIVLRHNKYSLIIADQGGSIITTGPVSDLEALICCTAFLNGYGTTTLDITPGIQLTAIINGNCTAGIHLYKAAVS